MSLGLLLSLCLQAQDRHSLTLADALALAELKGESVAIARAGLRSARAEQLRARAQWLPQLFGNANYTRTLASQYDDLFGAGQAPSAPSCDPLMVNANATVQQRLSELERFLLCGGPAAVDTGVGSGFDVLPFGRTNIYAFGLTASQPVFTGGRLRAQSRLADALYRTAALEVDSTNAQFMLDVSSAFYDAALADRMVEIARAALADAEQTLEFVQLGFKVGRLPEFDVLRAAVSRRNQIPIVVRRQAEREQAYLRFKQLLDLPPSAPVNLATNLSSETLPVPEPFEERLRQAEPLEQVYDRIPVLQSDAGVQQREANLRIARSQRWPSISINSDFGLFAYPTTLLPTATDQFRKNWTVGLTLQVPILTFGRIQADIESAKANLDQALAQRRLTRELSLLDTHVIISQLQTAREQWEAVSSGLVEARRAFEIASLRYRQGISSQLELNDARLALQQAQLNQVQAARDLQVARITVALLPLLPINVGPQAPSQTRPLQVQQNQQQFGGQGGNPFGNPARGTAVPPNAAPAASGIPGVPAGQVGIPGALGPIR